MFGTSATARKWVLGTGLILIAALLRSHGAGVTVVTHGLGGNVTDWVIPMCQKIPRYRSFPGTNYSLYQISITQPTPGVYTFSQTNLNGTNPMATDSGEILVALDWSTLSLGGTPTTTVAAKASEALLSAQLIPELSGRALVELPLHFIGHSRGASVITEMARILGAQGIWVDQVTTLDPHPVSNSGDPSMSNYANILFADNYWQAIPSGLFGTYGQSISGAYNRQLTSLDYGYSSAHSDVHLWYHGTIDLATPTTDTGATITSAMRASWWTTVEAAGTNAGFLYSTIGCGNRFSTQWPAGSASGGRIVDGMNQVWDFGTGVAANRVPLPTNNGAWPNLILLKLTGTNQFLVGQSIPLGCSIQCGTNFAANATLRFFLDSDLNPYNGNEVLLPQNVVAGSGITTVSNLQLGPASDPATTRSGDYWIGARITSGKRSRYAYATRKISLTPGQQAPLLLASHFQAGRFAFTISGSVGQSIIVESSTNLRQWVSLQTNTLSDFRQDFADPGNTGNPSRYYRLRLGP